jgi:hypothetical protein
VSVAACCGNRIVHFRKLLAVSDWRASRAIRRGSVNCAVILTAVIPHVSGLKH